MCLLLVRHGLQLLISVEVGRLLILAALGRKVQVLHSGVFLSKNNYVVMLGASCLED